MTHADTKTKLYTRYPASHIALFTRIVCIHCRAKNICPNAQSMGLSGK